MGRHAFPSQCLPPTQNLKIQPDVCHYSLLLASAVSTFIELIRALHIVVKDNTSSLCPLTHGNILQNYNIVPQSGSQNLFGILRHSDTYAHRALSSTFCQRSLRTQPSPGKMQYQSSSTVGILLVLLYNHAYLPQT